MSYTLLLCNGSIPHAELARSLAKNAGLVVCADGGANHARTFEIVPDIIIGDFDSITDETREHFERLNVQFRKLTGQEDTDFEKSLKYLRECGWRKTVILGATGKLLDHTLGNLSVLHRYAHETEFVLFDEAYRIDVVTKSAEYPTAKGARVSIVPFLHAEGVEYMNLEFGLEKETLDFGVREGTCNRSRSDSFVVKITSGALLLFRELTEESMKYEL